MDDIGRRFYLMVNNDIDRWIKELDKTPYTWHDFREHVNEYVRSLGTWDAYRAYQNGVGDDNE